MGRTSNAKSMEKRLMDGDITAESILKSLTVARKFTAKVHKYPVEIKIMAISLRSQGYIANSI